MDTSAPLAVRFGDTDLTWPSPELGELVDAPPPDDVPALRAQLDRDGYLLMRQLMEPDVVLAARQRVGEALDAEGSLAPDTPLENLSIDRTAPAPNLLGHRPVTHDPRVLDALESPALNTLFTRLFGEPAITLDFKWLRATGSGEMTGAHMDAVYMSRGSGRLMTAWVPLGDVTPDEGTLAIVPGSHAVPGFERVRQTYGRMDVDRDNVDGWFARHPIDVTREFGGAWSTASFRAGDVIVFTMLTMHASTTNLTNRYRLSCDVRFQPAADAPDPRWMGERPSGHVHHDADPMPIDEARQRWGLGSAPTGR